MVPHMNYCVLFRNKDQLTKWVFRERTAVYCENHTLTTLTADKSLARPTSRCILFDGENISFDTSLVLYIVLIFLQL